MLHESCPSAGKTHSIPSLRYNLSFFPLIRLVDELRRMVFQSPGRHSRKAHPANLCARGCQPSAPPRDLSPPLASRCSAPCATFEGKQVRGKVRGYGSERARFISCQQWRFLLDFPTNPHKMPNISEAAAHEPYLWSHFRFKSELISPILQLSGIKSFA